MDQPSLFGKVGARRARHAGCSSPGRPGLDDNSLISAGEDLAENLVISLRKYLDRGVDILDAASVVFDFNPGRDLTEEESCPSGHRLRTGGDLGAQESDEADRGVERGGG